MAFPALGRNSKGWQVEDAVNRILRWLNPGFGADNAGKVLTSNSTGTDLEWADVPHNLLQMVSFETGAVATGTTSIPYDDTIPQSTEGDQYMSLAVTPKSASSTLEIQVTFFGFNSGAAPYLVVALFRDSDSDALAVGAGQYGGSLNVQGVSLTHSMTSPGTGSYTFKVRAGGGSGTTTTFNGSGGSRRFGGKLASSIIIREYAA